MSFPLQLQRILLDEHTIELFVPDAGAVRQVYQSGVISFPYWSQVWPAAKALAHFLLRNPNYVEHKTVVELGAGLGLPSMVAARYATRVLCTDHEPDAVTIVQQSAAHLHLKNFSAGVLDWHRLPLDLSADVLLLSDINYEPDAFASLQTIIHRFLQNGTTILLSTPQRLMAREFVSHLLETCSRQEEIIVQHQESDVSVTVMVLKAPAAF